MMTSMPRRPRQSIGGMVFHVLNRAVGRGRIFDKVRDYLAFEKVLQIKGVGSEYHFLSSFLPVFSGLFSSWLSVVS